MKNPFLNISFLLFILSLYSFSFGQQKKITVTGTIIDSITGNPVPDVLIFFTDNISHVVDKNVNAIINNGKSTRSDNSGRFSTEISVGIKSSILTAIFVKGNYQIEAKGQLILLKSRAGFGTIKMRKEEFRTIRVFGTVKESSSDRPIPGVTVNLTNSTIIIDSVYYKLTTDNGGKFSKEMKIGKGGIVPPMILYSVEKTGYDSSGNTVSDNGKKEIDLGTIYIKGLTPVRNISTASNVLSKPTSIFVYSFNGKLLYSGPELNTAVLRKKGILSSFPVVIRYKYSHSNSRERLYYFIK